MWNKCCIFVAQTSDPLRVFRTTHMTEQEISSSNELQQHIAALREAIETSVGKRIQTPKDFDYLSQVIEERQGEHVSVSTLKRIWGYVPSSSIPRRSTLNILAQLVGNRDWDDFCNKDFSCSTDENTQTVIEREVKDPSRKRATTITAILLVGIVIALSFIIRARTTPASLILHAGQTFATVDDYLDIFDAHDRQTPWSVPVPNHPGLIIWGPRYHHPDWHNEGNADSLMPTITEYWQPADTTGFTPAAIAIRNADNYLRVTSFAELRITFMVGLPGKPSYTFLGVYCLDELCSDTARLVWKRIATECDLNHLDLLNQLRYKP